MDRKYSVTILDPFTDDMSDEELQHFYDDFTDTINSFYMIKDKSMEVTKHLQDIRGATPGVFKKKLDKKIDSFSKMTEKMDCHKTIVSLLEEIEEVIDFELNSHHCRMNIQKETTLKEWIAVLFDKHNILYRMDDIHKLLNNLPN